LQKLLLQHFLISQTLIVPEIGQAFWEQYPHEHFTWRKIKINARDRRGAGGVFRSKPEPHRTHEPRYLHTHASVPSTIGESSLATFKRRKCRWLRREPDFERSVFVFTDGRPRERALASPPLSRGFVATEITVKSYSHTCVGALRSCALNLAKRAARNIKSYA